MTSYGTLSSRSCFWGRRGASPRARTAAVPLELELFVVEPEIHAQSASSLVD